MTSKAVAQRMTVVALLLGMTLLKTSCAKDWKEGRVGGKIYICICQDTKVYLEVLLPQGTVRQIRETEVDATGGANGIRQVQSCLEKPTVNSPNHAYVAGCTGDYSPYLIGSSPDLFFVQTMGTRETVFESRFSHEKVDGFLWSGNSDSIAILTSSVHVSLNPRWWLYALSGHPKQFEKYRLEIVELQSHSHQGIELPYESSAGFGEIRGWSQM